MRLVEGILIAKEKISDDSYAITVSTLDKGPKVYQVSREAGWVCTLAGQGFLCENDELFQEKVGWGAKLALDDYDKVIVFRAFGQSGYNGVEQIAKEEIDRQGILNEGRLYRMFRRACQTTKSTPVIKALGLSRELK